MLQKLEDVERRYNELEEQLVDPAVFANRVDFARLGKDRAELEPIVTAYREWKKLRHEMEGHRVLLEASDAEIRELAKEELPTLRRQCEELEERLKILLLPKDPNDDRNVLLEIRGGV